jgi:hypothetical protein
MLIGQVDEQKGSQTVIGSASFEVLPGLLAPLRQRAFIEDIPGPI